MERPFLTIEELSAYLSIKKSSLYCMVERKEIPFYKIGHLLRFRQQEIDAWLENKKSLPEIQQDRPRGIVKTTRKVKLDMDRIISKSIAEAKRSRYNSDCGKPGQVRSLGKEVKDGTL